METEYREDELLKKYFEIKYRYGLADTGTNAYYGMYLPIDPDHVNSVGMPRSIAFRVKCRTFMNRSFYRWCICGAQYRGRMLACFDGLLPLALGLVVWSAVFVAICLVHFIYALETQFRGILYYGNYDIEQFKIIFQEFAGILGGMMLISGVMLDSRSLVSIGVTCDRLHKSALLSSLISFPIMVLIYTYNGSLRYLIDMATLLKYNGAAYIGCIVRLCIIWYLMDLSLSYVRAKDHGLDPWLRLQRNVIFGNYT